MAVLLLTIVISVIEMFDYSLNNCDNQKLVRLRPGKLQEYVISISKLSPRNSLLLRVTLSIISINL